MKRVVLHPTHEYKGFRLRAGKPLPFGSTIVPGGVNFSVFSKHAYSCELVLFKKHSKKPFVIIPFLDQFRIGNVFAMIVFDLDYENVEYGYRMDGPFDPAAGHRFNKRKILLDPYAKSIGGREVWGKELDSDNIYPNRGQIFCDDFDWEDDRPLEIPTDDLIIYEMHVRGFTAHSSSGVKHPGTFAGLREKIHYLKELGVNCVELMPIHEFNEFDNIRVSPVSGKRLLNYWGYSNIGFFAPKAGYAANGKYGMQVDELKATIKDLHKNGIEVILDVVFNHTAEGNELGPYISYRGIDNKTYYMLTPEGYYYNFSGCGNTLNCNNPVTRNMILDCLRYWAADYHIDGFRFDLASILGRDQNGDPMNSPPLLETLAFDPILGKCKLIAEAWDAAGLYQVGSFPSWGRWAEWNGRYRDDLRKFLKGDEGMVCAMAQRLEGSPDLYLMQQREACASINFITCHDGFTLMDLFSYNEKDNEANAENNSDGTNNNDSWNCGREGATANKEVNRLRIKQIKNAITILMLSRGVPMVLSGDEIGKSQDGNNNAYCQDNEISWLNWKLLEKNKEIYNYFKKMIAFRRAHPVLNKNVNDKNWDDQFDILWCGQKACEADWSRESRLLAFLLTGKNEHIYSVMNMHWEACEVELPELPGKMRWYLFSNTDMSAPRDILELNKEIRLDDQSKFLAGPRSVAVLVGKK